MYVAYHQSLSIVSILQRVEQCAIIKTVLEKRKHSLSRVARSERIIVVREGAKRGDDLAKCIILYRTIKCTYVTYLYTYMYLRTRDCNRRRRRRRRIYTMRRRACIIRVHTISRPKT